MLLAIKTGVLKKREWLSPWDWLAIGLAILFTAVFFWLNNRHFQTFNLRGPDIATFSQAMWNTSHGRGFLFSTIIQRSVLGFHFTPIFALLSPLLIIWEDVRILFLAQIIAIAVTGLILYRLVASRHPRLAFWFLLAFYLNPALHEVAIHELRRIPFAMPFITLALYGLYFKKRWLTFIALLFALLCKENVSIIVFMVGVYLLLFEREWRWGSLYVVWGVAWALIVPNYVIPAFAPVAVTEYPQLNYFSNWGESPQEIILNMVRQPQTVVALLFDRSSLAALGRLFLPLALVLPFLAPQWLLLGLPTLGLLLLSGYEPMHTLHDWYLAPVLPILFFAMGAGLNRLSEKWAGRLTGLLLVTTLIGFFLWSPVPLGRSAWLSDYSITHHHEMATAVTQLIPEDAAVATQAAFITQLALRPEIYIFPWADEAEVDYYLLDPILNPYPLGERELGFARENLVADPENVVVAEVDQLFLIQRGGEQHPAISVNAVAEESIKLDRVEVAVADEDNWFQPIEEVPVTLQPGDSLRVSLYWEALAAVGAERTVSVRLADSSGALVGQQDMQPNHGARPTSWWEPGWHFRDTYYLTIAEAALPGTGSLGVLLYDSFTQERVPFADDEVLQIVEVEIK